MTQLTSTVIVIDDDPAICKQLKNLIRLKCNCNTLCFHDGRDAYPVIEAGEVAVVLLDWMMPYPGEKVLKYIVENFPESRVVVMTALQDVETIVGAMKLGAKDFLPKPYDSERLVAIIKTSLENFEYRRNYLMLKNKMLSPNLDDTVRKILFKSKAIYALLLIIEGLSKSRQPVLITGETGVGKEAFARAVHDSSGVKGPFVAVNAGGLDDIAFTDTLFGHKKGAFTGADSNRDGLVKTAEGGTLFLDEVGDLAPESQVKLLRFLQEGEYYRLGSDVIQKADVRVVTATNAMLKTSANFRKDLYYRLSTHSLPIPPLRDRMEDVPLLAHHFVGQSALELKKPVPTLSTDLLYALQGYHFPGNVRELKNIINDMVVLNRSGVLTAKDLPIDVASTHSVIGLGEMEARQITAHPLYELFGSFPTIEKMESYLIAEVMRITNNNQSASAKILGMSRPTLCKRLKVVQ